ncbi:dihydrolipoamide acetyltransferase family protein [Salinibaculum salinum]|uniref:dihydrolipoamide acetyltransferase family protein n=1 Tax=Salinibaculum salinum TaxID=3131996 RepID=UPI0030EE02FD
MTKREYEFPDVGEGVAEGDLLEWYVTEGEQVEEDQLLAEVETDKAVVDIPSPVDGTISELLYEEGDTIPVGETFVVFDVSNGEAVTDETPAAEPADKPAADSDGDTARNQQPAAEKTASDVADTTPSDVATLQTTGTGQRSFASPSVRRLAREHGVDIERLEGSGTGGRVTETDVKTAIGATDDRVPGQLPTGATAEQTQEQPSDSSASKTGGRRQAVSQKSSGSVEQRQAAGRDKTLATPATRRVAHDLGVNIDDVPAVTQREGEAFVTADAVQAFAEGDTTQSDAVGAEVDTVADAEPVSATVEERVPYRGVRRTIGEQMERSKFTIPHVSTVDEADVTELVEVREELGEAAAEHDVNLTYLAFVIMAVGKALQEYPYVNATLDSDAEEIVLKNYYNVGIATEAEDGLRVPVVKNVDEKGLLGIASGVEEVVQRARDGSISRGEMQDSTFTVTNIGPYGGQHGTPIINYPEVAILAMGEITEKPRVVDGEIVPRHVMNLSMSFDHRVLDGATAQQFLNTVEKYLEKPELLLLE